MHMRIDWSRRFNTIAFLCEKEGFWCDLSRIAVIFIISH